MSRAIKQHRGLPLASDALDSDATKATKPSVIIVDDEPFMLEVLSEFLQSDFEVTAMSDPKLALQEFDSRQFNLVISDFHMPSITGIKFLKLIKKMDPKVVTVLSSGQSLEELERELGFNLSKIVDETMSKPFDDPNAVVDFLKRCLAKKRHTT